VLPVGAGHLLGRMDGERHVHTALPLVFFTGDGFLSSLSIACVSGLDPLYLYLYLYLQLQLCLCLPLCSERQGKKQLYLIYDSHYASKPIFWE